MDLDSKAMAVAPEQHLLTRGEGNATAWSRFVDVNRRFCRRHLQRRLYQVSNTKALDYWFTGRIKGDADGALLEFGCGRNFRLTRLVGDRFAQRFATDIEDISPDIIPAGVQFQRCTSDEIPFPNEQFSAVVICSVIEHLERPEQTFAELARVTKPGGAVLMNLPNKWDYVSVIARLSGSAKSSILKSVVRIRWEDFPVRYRCNTRRALHRIATNAGLEVVEFMPLPGQPWYLSFFVPLYMLGAVYQFVVSICALDALQPSFVVLLRKGTAHANDRD